MTGYQLPFLSQPLQQELPQETDLNLKEKFLVMENIGDLLKKAAIEKGHMKKALQKVSLGAIYF